MSGYRGGRGGGGAGGYSRQKGAFLNGVWHCDCNPPLPAVHLQVKKEGDNKGRFFRVCQKDQNDNSRCKFFLWDDNAAPREVAALANNSRTEPGRLSSATTTPSRPRPQRAVSPPPPYTPEAGPSDPSRKRGRQVAQEDDDEFDIDGDAGFDEGMAQALEAVETPSKKPRTEPFTTPARRRLPWENNKAPQSAPQTNGLHTPQTESRNGTDLFPTRFTEPGSSFLTPSRYKQMETAGSQTLTPASSPVETPTPARFKDAASPNADSDLSQEVGGVLREGNVQLTDQVRRNLTSILSKHSTIAEGIKRGRDVARASIKAKDAKVTELTYRVSTLEAELEAEKAKVQHLQWQVEHGPQSG